MRKSAFISDVLFAFFLTFLFLLCLFRHLRISLPLSFLLATAFGGVTGWLTAVHLQKKRNAVFLKKSDEEKKEKLLLHLALLPDEEKTEYFKTALNKNEPTQRFGKLRVFTRTTMYFLQFSFSPVGADTVAKLSRLKTGKRRILLCSNIEPQAKELCSRLKIEVRTGEEVYADLKEKDALPSRYLGEENATEKNARKFRLWLKKSNARHFLVGGAVLLITSLYTPFPKYYLLFGNAMLITALCVRIFGND